MSSVLTHPGAIGYGLHISQFHTIHLWQEYHRDSFSSRVRPAFRILFRLLRGWLQPNSATRPTTPPFKTPLVNSADAYAKIAGIGRSEVTTGE